MLQQLDLFEVPIDEAVVVFKKKKAQPLYPPENQEDAYEIKSGINQPGLFDHILNEPSVPEIVEPCLPETPEKIKQPEVEAEQTIDLQEVNQLHDIAENEDLPASSEVNGIDYQNETPAIDATLLTQSTQTIIIAQTETLQQEELKEPIIYSNEQLVVKIKPKSKAHGLKKEVPIAEQPKIEQKRGRKSYKEIDASIDLVDVPDDEILNQKLYYTISEVAGWFKVNTSLIRYWENEFDILQPRKTRKGDRLFRVEDIKNLQLIYFLLRQRKFSIEGAKIYLKNNRKNLTIETQLIKSLTGFRSFLKDLKELL